LADRHTQQTLIIHIHDMHMEMIIRWLIMDIHPQRAVSQLPLVLHYSPRLSTYASQHAQMRLSEVPKTTNIGRRSNGDEVERGYGREVPFHIGEQDVTIVHRRIPIEHFVRLGSSFQYVYHPATMSLYRQSDLRCQLTIACARSGMRRYTVVLFARTARESHEPPRISESNTCEYELPLQDKQC